MIVVAALLEKGDFVKRVGVTYRVTAVDEKYVYLKAASMKGAKSGVGGYGSSTTVGINSKEKMLLVKDCDGLKIT